MKKVSVLFVLIVISISSIFAQTIQQDQVSSEELKQFATAFQQVKVVDQQAQQKMIKAVEEEGLEVQRFTEIQQAEQNPNKEVDAPAEVLEQYTAATQKLGLIQEVAQQEMQQKIEEEGLTVSRYQEIAAVVQGSPELQQKVQQYLQG